MVVLVRSLQRSRANMIYVESIGEDLLWKLAHMITETKKFHDLLSAGWSPRKASGIIEPESEGVRI